MPYIIITIALLAFVLMAPVKTTLTFGALLLIITSTVKISAQHVAGTSFSYSEAFKAVFLSLVLVLLAGLALLSFATHHDAMFFGLSALLVLAGFFVAYVLGFSLGLGTSFSTSAIVAMISTLVSGAFIWLTKAM